MLPLLKPGTVVLVSASQKTGVILGPLRKPRQAPHCASCTCHAELEVMPGWYEVEMKDWWIREDKTTYYAEKPENDTDKKVIAGFYQGELEEIQ